MDANSAFLSWSAAYRVKVLGEEEDLRDVPSVVAGDKESRHSIILAKSTPAKQTIDPNYTWTPKKSEPASFEEMMNRFKQTSDEKFSDLKRKNPETKRSKRGAVR